MNKVCKKLMFLFCLSIGVFLLGVKFGYCENYYPDGLDNTKWGMSFEEVLNIVKSEDRETGVVNPDGEHGGYLNTRGTIFGYPTVVDYRFVSNRLISISIEPIKIKADVDGGNSQYEQIGRILTSTFGPPSVRNGDKDARWNYPDGREAISISNEYTTDGFYPNVFRIYKTWLSLNAPDSFDDAAKKMLEAKTKVLNGSATVE